MAKMLLSSKEKQRNKLDKKSRLCFYLWKEVQDATEQVVCIYKAYI